MKRKYYMWIHPGKKDILQIDKSNQFICFNTSKEIRAVICFKSLPILLRTDPFFFFISVFKVTRIDKLFPSLRSIHSSIYPNTCIIMFFSSITVLPILFGNATAHTYFILLAYPDKVLDTIHSYKWLIVLRTFRNLKD